MAPEHRHLHDVLQQQIRTAQQTGGKQRQVEVGKKPRAEHGDDLDREDAEAPEDEEVHPAGLSAR